jgi:hypothetical protein
MECGGRRRWRRCDFLQKAIYRNPLLFKIIRDIHHDKTARVVKIFSQLGE